jgi:hypothetical protein
MSDIGVVLILFVGVLLLVGILRFLAWLTEIQNEHGSLGRASVNTIKRYVATTPRVMSRSEDDAEPVPDRVVPVLVPGTPLPAGEFARNLTEDQIVELLATARNAKGKYLYSGKKIYALVGGNYGLFLATMRRLRGEEKDELPDEPMIYTPIAGRPTKASNFDPELAYQPPD